MRLFVVLVALLLSLAKGSTEIDSPASHYSEVKLANKSDSLERIKNVKLLSYKFKYDSVPDRNIMGILGADAQRWFPDCIDVVPSYPIPSKNRSAKNIVLTNFPVVDKNVLYMHGVAALQELLEKYDKMLQTIASMDSIDKELALKYQTIDSKLDSEISAQLQEKLNWIEIENEIAKKQIELEELRNAEDRVLIDKQLDEEKKLLEFQAELAKQRMKLEEELEKDNLKNLLQLEKDLAEKREVMRRETAQTLQVLKMEQNKELENKKLENEKEKIRAEIKAKGDQERLNEEITIRKIQLQSKQDTERMVEGIKAVSKQLTLLLKDIFSRPKQVLILSGIVVALFLFFYLTREFISMLRQFIQSQIGRPSLVRETSYHWSLIPQFVTDLFVAPEKISLTFKAIEERFRNVILSSDDKERVINLAVATRNTRRSGAPYRHILLHGPPGTGKTLIARKLAECSGMDYAIMSGGDVAPLGEDAVNQLHDLFRWAGRSRKGLLVFIDEAEAFLSTRRHIGGESSGGSKEGQDAHMRNALNALLYQTGMPSRNFMLVLATNRPEDLDEAILDRMDITLQISLPGLQQRIDLISLYLQVYVLSVLAEETKRGRSLWSWLIRGRGGQSSVDSSCLEPETLQRIAVKTSGFSGREIAKLFIAVQYAMYLAEGQVLTQALFENTVDIKINDHLVKSGGFVTSGSGNKHENLLDKTSITTPADVKRAANGRNSGRKQ